MLNYITRTYGKILMKDIYEENIGIENGVYNNSRILITPLFSFRLVLRHDELTIYSMYM